MPEASAPGSATSPPYVKDFPAAIGRGRSPAAWRSAGRWIPGSEEDRSVAIVMIGQTISHYEIVEKIGEGGMGVVYRAHDATLDRFVALKFLPRELSEDEERKQLFIREARAASALEHPNICSIHAIEETDDGQLFIAMPFYEGETVERKIERGPLPVEEITELALQVASGLAAAHERGILHRDIKPANLMVTRDGTVKILDFGLAKRDTGAEDPSHSGSLMGSAAYISPEQVDGKPADAQTDIWAFGVVLYEMVTGKRPFRGPNPMALLFAVAHHEPEPPIDLVPETPADLDLLIRRALAKDRKERYRNIEELSNDLKVFAEVTQTVPVPVVSGRPWIFRSPAGPGRRSLRWPIPLAAAAMAVVTGLLLRALWPSQPREGPMPIALVGFHEEAATAEQEWVGIALCELLIFELPDGAELRWVGKDRARCSGSAAGEPDRGLSHPEAELAVVGSYRLDPGAEGEIEVELRVQDPQTGSERELVTQKGRVTELLPLAARLADALAAHLDVARQARRGNRDGISWAPANPEAARLLGEARARLRLLDAPAAHAALLEALEHEPGNPLLTTAMTETLWYLGREQEARQYADTAVRSAQALAPEARLLCWAQRLVVNEELTRGAALLRALWVADEARRPKASDSVDRLEQGLFLADVLVRAKQNGAALEILAPLRDPHPDNLRILLLDAETAEQYGPEKQREIAQKAATMAYGREASILIARARFLAGKAAGLSGDFEQAAAQLHAAIEIYDQTGFQRGAADSWNALGNVQFFQRDLAGAKASYEAAARLFEQIGSRRQRTRVLANMALVVRNMGDFSAAIEIFQEMVEGFRSSGDRIAQANTLANMAVIYVSMGQIAAAEAAYGETFEILGTLNAPEQEAFALTGLGELLTLKGELPAARQKLDQALDMLEEIGDRQGQPEALDVRAWVLHYQGELAGAQQSWEEAAAIFEQSENPSSYYAIVLHGQGVNLTTRGELGPARACFREALAIQDSLLDPRRSAQTRVSLAELLLAENKVGEAEKRAREALRDLAESHWPTGASRAHGVLALCLLLRNLPEAAQREIDNADALLETIDSPVYRLPVGLTAARVLAARGEAAEARERLQRLLATATTRGFVGRELEARLVLGEIELCTGSARAGRSRLSNVEDEARTKGFALIADTARRSLRIGCSGWLAAAAFF